MVARAVSKSMLLRATSSGWEKTKWGTWLSQVMPVHPHNVLQPEYRLKLLVAARDVSVSWQDPVLVMLEGEPLTRCWRKTA
jgi:hypothetical protein